MSGKNICLILSGSIAAYKACELTSRLVKLGHTVQTVATAGALHFVGESTLEGLTDRPVYTDLWARRENMTHITLRRWADLFIFYPASANRINQMAAGIADDLVGALFLANNFEKPFWIAPAMNTGMLQHPATQTALNRLQEWGCRIVGGESGTLACGDVGAGRLAEPEVLADFVSEWGMTPQKASRGRILVTGGAMTEPIDAVRSITNTSTGRTASALVAGMVEAGWSVDYVHHETADKSTLRDVEGKGLLKIISYRAFADFDATLSVLLSKNTYYAIIHAAAVSDYHVQQPHGEKLESGSVVNLSLAPNPKLLTGLKKRACGNPIVVGFKLSVGADEQAAIPKVATILSQGTVDFVVWNDLHAIGAGTEMTHPFAIFAPETANPRVVKRGKTNTELAQALLEIISAQEVSL